MPERDSERTILEPRVKHRAERALEVRVLDHERSLRGAPDMVVLADRPDRCGAQVRHRGAERRR